MELKDKLSKL